MHFVEFRARRALALPHAIIPLNFVIQLAVAASFLLAAGTVDASSSYFAIRNKLPGLMGVECWSEVEHLPRAIVVPETVYNFDMTWEKQTSWTCSISGPDSDSATFLLWWRNGFPCGSRTYACLWVADDYGMSIRRGHDGVVEHVYHGP